MPKHETMGSVIVKNSNEWADVKGISKALHDAKFGDISEILEVHEKDQSYVVESWEMRNAIRAVVERYKKGE